MENLTNEQILDIINFYKECGISEDMYLSTSGVLDLFSLLGIEPEFDEYGTRVPTVYEQLCVAPKFVDKKEVPIVFAIKHKVSAVSKGVNLGTFVYAGAKEKTDGYEILNKYKQDYLSAMASGNLNEAANIYDLIDKLTGGQAEKFIGMYFNYIKFYKKMKKQLIVDMFANFLILLMMNKKYSFKNCLQKLDKLYKAFVEDQMKTDKQFFASPVSGDFEMPVLAGVTISMTNDADEFEETSSKVSFLNKKIVNVVKKQKIHENSLSENIMSFVKDKLNLKLGSLNLSQKSEEVHSEKEKFEHEKNANVLENN